MTGEVGELGADGRCRIGDELLMRSRGAGIESCDPTRESAGDVTLSHDMLAAEAEAEAEAEAPAAAPAVLMRTGLDAAGLGPNSGVWMDRDASMRA